MKSDKKTIVVVGGGITGLTAAYYAQQAIKSQNIQAEVILIEGSNRLGGKIQTIYKDGYIIETGPDSFLERKVSAAELAKAVGLESELVNNTAGRSFVLVKEKLHPMPQGAVMGIPTKLGPFLSTELFSIQGKMRAAADLLLPPSLTVGDQSLGSFFRRRLGDEVVENLVEPLLSGIYAGDIDQLSLMSTFPQFYEVEQHHRSLIVGMKKTSSQATQQNKLSKKNQGVFLTLKTGLQSLVDAIEDKLNATSVIKGTKIVAIDRQESKFELKLSNGSELLADSVIMALPHQALANLFVDHAPIHQYEQIPSTSVATVAMGFDANQIEDILNGTGFVVSRNSDYTITACTWTHKKWPHTTPDGKVLLRCYVGRPGDETTLELSDAEIEQIVLDDLQKTMNITATPEFSIITRWRESMPQYLVGHKKRFNEMKSYIKNQLPGLFIAGSSFEGIGLPDCINQGKAASDEALQYINKKHAGSQ